MKRVTQDPKTTVSGLAPAIVALAAALGVPIPMEVVLGAIAVGMFLVGLFAKDK
jgi:hypothetical protein